MVKVIIVVLSILSTAILSEIAVIWLLLGHALRTIGWTYEVGTLMIAISWSMSFIYFYLFIFGAGCYVLVHHFRQRNTIQSKEKE